jgi:hypothetical protein
MIRIRHQVLAVAALAALCVGCASQVAGEAAQVPSIAGGSSASSPAEPVLPSTTSRAPGSTIPTSSDPAVTTSPATTEPSTTSAPVTTSPIQTTGPITPSSSRPTVTIAITVTPTKPPTTAPTPPPVTVTSRPTVTRTTTEVGPPAHPIDVKDYDRFQSPSKNISCMITSDEVRCDIVEKTFTAPKPSDCSMGVPSALVIPSGQPARVRCISDTVADPGNPVLEYGQTTSSQGFTCASEEDGMHCREDATGHTFRLSRGSYDLG